MTKGKPFSQIHDVDTTLVDITINIRQEYKVKLPDAIIAATALAKDLTLISRNLKDFHGITDLKFINPYEL
ncbi:PIN domain-containing protein [Arcicella aquatica]|uniref:PIN domain-containing protein n=1 Tax=Arcicella aquatica TaxID=217141 RepID=UPI0038993623